MAAVRIEELLTPEELARAKAIPHKINIEKRLHAATVDDLRILGLNVFNRIVMEEQLPYIVYKKLATRSKAANRYIFNG
jgi:hypothetical protein